MLVESLESSIVLEIKYFVRLVYFIHRLSDACLHGQIALLNTDLIRRAHDQVTSYMRGDSPQSLLFISMFYRLVLMLYCNMEVQEAITAYPDIPRRVH